LTRTRVLVVAAFLIAFAAGLTTGVAVGRSRHRPRGGSVLTRQLGLTEEQQAQMRRIWSGIDGDSIRAYFERRREIQAERDEALRDLLRASGLQAEYETIMQVYNDQLAELAQERRAAREEAERKTMEILTEPQRKRWQEMLRQREHGERGRPRRGQQPEEGPTAAGPGTTGRQATQD